MGVKHLIEEATSHRLGYRTPEKCASSGDRNSLRKVVVEPIKEYLRIFYSFT